MDRAQSCPQSSSSVMQYHGEQRLVYVSRPLTCISVASRLKADSPQRWAGLNQRTSHSLGGPVVHHVCRATPAAGSRTRGPSCASRHCPSRSVRNCGAPRACLRAGTRSARVPPRVPPACRVCMLGATQTAALKFKKDFLERQSSRPLHARSRDSPLSCAGSRVTGLSIIVRVMAKSEKM